MPVRPARLRVVSRTGLDPLKYATHSMRRTKAPLIYRRTGISEQYNYCLGTFVSRLQPNHLSDQTARQLPDLSTSIRVRSSFTDGSHLRGALPRADEEFLLRSVNSTGDEPDFAWRGDPNRNC